MGIESLLIFIIIGAFIAGWLFPRLGFAIGGGILAAIINATLGAIILLLVVKVLKRA
ncbi:MAG: GlsB/YeaQ/YmgE family stress response membrane protein [Mesorhizobium sp.]|nr:MAG: GlsB/YeaQ/YmgE family stress response membrane protein [Mesorhizobium sp.]TIX71016.1 MAG: GlsB/YeaQ/YmgE family stress response membrane protein [Mesorhizobium sp.]